MGYFIYSCEAEDSNRAAPRPGRIRKPKVSDWGSGCGVWFGERAGYLAASEAKIPLRLLIVNKNPYQWIFILELGINFSFLYNY